MAIPATEDGAERGFAGLRLGKVGGKIFQARGGECGGLRLEGSNSLLYYEAQIAPDMILRVIVLRLVLQ